MRTCLETVEHPAEHNLAHIAGDTLEKRVVDTESIVGPVEQDIVIELGIADCTVAALGVETVVALGIAEDIVAVQLAVDTVSQLEVHTAAEIVAKEVAAKQH